MRLASQNCPRPRRSGHTHTPPIWMSFERGISCRGSRCRQRRTRCCPPWRSRKTAAPAVR